MSAFRRLFYLILFVTVVSFASGFVYSYLNNIAVSVAIAVIVLLFGIRRWLL